MLSWTGAVTTAVAKRQRHLPNGKQIDYVGRTMFIKYTVGRIWAGAATDGARTASRRPARPRSGKRPSTRVPRVIIGAVVNHRVLFA